MAAIQSPSEPDPLVLTETKPSPGLALTAPERRQLERNFEATISTGVDGTYTVRPGSIIGSLQIAGRTILVRPKININRVLFMTAYAADPYNWDNDWSAIGAADNITDGVAALFAAAYKRTVGQGLLRSYRTVEQEAMLVRGRIQWQRQLRRCQQLPLPLRFQVHDEDIVENQILRAAVQVLRQQQLRSNKLRGSVTAMWRQLRELSPIAQPLAELNQLVWTRHNAHYKPLMRLAHTVLTGAMPDISAGPVSVVGFTLRLFDVFEQFVRSAVREALRASITEMPDDTGDCGLVLDEGQSVPLRPDLLYRVGGRWRWVGDVKYKRDAGRGQNPDLYQLLAYATATRLNKAALIYAEGPATDLFVHHVRNTGIELQVQHLDLRQPPAAILRAINRFVAPIRQASPAT